MRSNLRKPRRPLSLLVFVVLATPGSSHGYGVDIHYTATYALAVAAGWPSEDAHVIASATYAVDKNYDTVATLTIPTPGPDDPFWRASQAMDSLQERRKLRRPFDSRRMDYRVSELLERKLPQSVGDTQTDLEPGNRDFDPHSPSRTNLSLHCISATSDARISASGSPLDLAPLRVGTVAERTGAWTSSDPARRAGRAEDVANRLAVLLDQAAGEIAGRGNNRSRRTASLFAIGILLHCQQDSWSHSGWGAVGQYLGHGYEYIHDQLVWGAWLLGLRPHPSPPMAGTMNRLFDPTDGEMWVEALDPSVSEARAPTLVSTKIFGKIGMANAGKFINGDNPAVRPAQLRGAMLESHAILVELRTLWTEQSPRVQVSQDDQERLLRGLSHPFGRTMNPMGDDRPMCIREVVAHWLHGLKSKDPAESLRAWGDLDDDVPRIEAVPRDLEPDSELADVAMVRMRNKVSTCSAWIQDWIQPAADNAGATPPASENLARIVVPDPVWPVLLADENEWVTDVSLEFTLAEAICDDGRYHFLEDTCERSQCSTVPAGCER